MPLQFIIIVSSTELVLYKNFIGYKVYKYKTAFITLQEVVGRSQ